jgi:hypothetical protein
MQPYTYAELVELHAARKRAPIPVAELQEMIERCRRATTGGWTYAVERGGCTIGGPVCYMDENNRMVVGTSGDWGPTADPECDAEFIAHARTDLPRLIVEVMQLRGLNPLDLDALEFGPHRAGDPQTEAQDAATCVVVETPEP